MKSEANQPLNARNRQAIGPKKGPVEEKAGSDSHTLLEWLEIRWIQPVRMNLRRISKGFKMFLKEKTCHSIM